MWMCLSLKFVSVCADTGFLPLPNVTVITYSNSVLQGLSVVNIIPRDYVTNADNGFLPFSRRPL